MPVAARTGPGTRSGWLIQLGPWAEAARATARSAAAAHASQADALPEVRRRLDGLGDREQLRWLLPPDRAADELRRRIDTQVLIEDNPAQDAKARAFESST